MDWRAHLRKLGELKDFQGYHVRRANPMLTLASVSTILIRVTVTAKGVNLVNMCFPAHSELNGNGRDEWSVGLGITGWKFECEQD